MVVRHGDEQWLIERARRGDLQAFNSLVERHQQQIYNVCLRMLGAREAAEDATQETFLSAYRAIARLQGDNVRAWLLRIATNVSYDELRRRARRPSGSLDRMMDDPEHPFTPVSEDPGPEDVSLRSELRAEVERALQTLPPDQRIAVILCDIHGLAYDEIAEVMGSSLGTVKSRVSRGRSKMREHLRTTAEPISYGQRQQE